VFKFDFFCSHHDEEEVNYWCSLSYSYRQIFKLIVRCIIERNEREFDHNKRIQ